MSTSLSSAEGHFLLESGMHTDRWFDLDGEFCDTAVLQRRIDALVEYLRAFRPTAICGPLRGGAFLAQAVATKLVADFLWSRPTSNATSGLFAAHYELPPPQHALARDRRVAVVDDMISAGSSAIATATALRAAGASVVAVAALYLVTNSNGDDRTIAGLPVFGIEAVELPLWTPEQCPLCRQGLPLSEAPR